MDPSLLPAKRISSGKICEVFKTFDTTEAPPKKDIKPKIKKIEDKKRLKAELEEKLKKDLLL